MGTEMGTDGQVLKAASFFTIGVKDIDDDDCVRLSDLKVTDYGDDGCAGNVWIDILRKDGAIVETEGMNTSYYWFTEDFDHPVEGWYDGDGCILADDESVLGNADEITFKLGEGICFNADTDFEGAKLQCNGQVLEAKSAYIITRDGQSIAGNPLARTVYLSELTVTGYGEDGCAGNVWIDILRKDGAIVETEGMNTSYYWFTEDFDHPVEGWYDGDGCPLSDDESVLGNADEIPFVAGAGICINADSGFEGCSLEFPSLGLK